jgi:hypothetical protein
VQLDHQLDPVADGLAHLAERLDAPAQVLERDRLAAGGLGVRVESGQIFIPVMPCSSRLCASDPSSVRNQSRSSYGPAAAGSAFQFETGRPAVSGTRRT